MPQIVLKNIQFTNVKDKRTGTGISTILTLTNVGNSSLGKYVNSENFYTLVSALDIAWGDISVGNGVIISDTADLINWISSLPASGGGGKSAYELYVEEEEGKGNTPLSLSEWLESLQGQQGIAGISPHIDPSTGNWFIGETNTGVHAQGIDGSQGPQGPQGLQGKSNYELYLETVPQGETPLTQLEWLDSLKGLNGANGINGTNGTDGKSAYEIYVEHVPNGSTALTEEAWLASLKGKDGNDGPRGYEGKSAYEIYFEKTQDPLSEDEWLESLKGADGTMSFQDLTEEERASLVGETGPVGPSAYQSYRNTTTDDPILTEEEWVASLHGQAGEAGTTPHIDASTKHWFIGNTDTNILAEGVNGQDGQPGADGSNGITPHIDPTTGNWFIGETDTEVHAQGVPGIDGSNGITPHIDPTTGNWFIGETDTEVHAQGETGQSGADGITPHIDASTGNWFIGETNTGIPAQGPTGQNGADGSTGKSAYELYVDGIQDGEPLSQEDWLASLKGDEGDSAYEVAVANGFVGTEQQWLDSLLPTINVDPSSNNASDIYWFIKGEKTQYRAIPQIISITSAAYEALQEKDETAIYVITDSQYNQDNEVAYRIGNITPTTDMNNLDVSVRRSDNVVYFDFTLPIANLDVSNLTEAQATLLRGKSNYQIYVDNHDVDLDGPLLTEEQWLATLKGEVGNDGKSAYELYAENYISTHGDDTDMLTESEWLNSLIPQIVKDSSDNLYWHINNQKTQYRAFPGIQFLTLDEYNALETKEDDVVYIIDNDKDATALTFNIGNVTTSALETDASVNIHRIDNSIYFDFVLPFSIDSSEYKGESAYEIYRRNASTGEILSETAWLDSLKGKSAYELFAAANPTSVYTNESQWLASLKGETGKDGSQGPQGPMPTITINQEGNWVVNNQVMQSALGRLPEISTGLYIDPDTGDEIAMNTWWLNGVDTNVPTSLGVEVTTFFNTIGAIGNAQEFEPSTYYTAEDEEVIEGTKEVGDLKTPAVAAVPHTVKSYVDNAVANVDIDTSNIYTKSEVDQKFDDLINNAPETLDTLKEIADKLSEEDTSLGQLNAILLNKADTSTTYTKAEIDSIIENLDTGVDPNDLSIYQLKSTLINDISMYELKSDLTNDLSIYELKSDLANDLSIYELKSDLTNDLSIYVLNSSLIEIEEVISSAISGLNNNKVDVSALNDYVQKTALENSEKVIANALVHLKESVTNIDASIVDIKQNAGSVKPNDLSIYELKSDLANDLSIYELKSDLTNDLSIYELKSDLTNDLSIYELKSDLANDLSIYTSKAYVDQKFDDLINNAPETLDTLKEIADKLSDEDTSLGQLNTILLNKADTSTTYTKSEVDTLYNNINSSLNDYVLKTDLDDTEKVVATAITQINSSLNDYVLKTELDDTEKVVATAIIQINSSLNDYVLKSDLDDTEKVIATALIQLNESVTNIDASIVDIKQNGSTVNPNDLSIYELKSDLANDLSIYKLKSDLANDLSIYKLKSDLANDLSIYTSKTYVDQKFDDLINNAPETLDTLKEIADKLSDEDTSLGQLNAILAVKADTSTTYTKSEVDTLYNNINSSLNDYVQKTVLEDTEEAIAAALVQLHDSVTNIDASIVDIKQNSGSANPNDLSIYQLKSTLINDISMYELKSDLTNDLSIYQLKSTLINDISMYELKEDLINDLSIYQLKEDLTNDLSIYQLKSTLINDISMYELKSDLTNDLSIYELKSDLANDLSIYTSKAYVDQKFDDLINNAPATLDTLKEIADKLGDEDTSLGQLNAILLNKADTSTTYTKSEVDTLYNNINSSLNDYVLKTALVNSEKVIAAALFQLHESVTNIDASIVDIKQNAGSVNPNDLSIYELKEDLTNDLSIYQLKSTLINDISMYELKSDLTNDLSIYTSKAYVDQKFEDLIGQAPETLDTLKEIADKLSDEDTSLGQLNAILLNKADTSTTYTKSEVDSIIENLDTGVDPNDLSIYELKSDLANDLSIYELKSDLTNDLSIYELKSDLANDLSIYVLNSSLIEIEEVISGAISSLNNNKVDVSVLVQLNETITNIDASIANIRQNSGSVNPNDLSIYELKSDLSNDLSIYELKEDLINDLSIYQLKSTLINDISMYELKEDLINDLSIYELKSDLANDLSIYTSKAYVDTLYNNINSSLNDYVLKTDLDDISTALIQLNESVTNIDASIIDIKQNGGTVKPNDLSIYELKSDLANDLSIYTSKAYVDQKFDDLINNAPETLDTLKEIADKLSDEDTSLGQLNAILAVKADTSTTYTKAEIDSIIENLDTGVDQNDLSIYELKSDLANDLSIYQLKSTLINDISMYELKSDLTNDLSIYELKSDLANDLSIYELKSDLANDLSIYELKADLANDLSIYVLNSSLIEIEEVISSAISGLNTNKVDVSALNDYELKSDLANDLSIYTSKAYVDQKFEDLINNAPATLDTLKEIADKLNDEDTSLGQLNAILAVKADTSTTYTKSEVNTLYNNINSSLNDYALKTDLDDISTALIQINDSITTIDASILDIKQNGSGNSGINSSVLDNYVLKTYIGTLPNKTEDIYYTQEEIANATAGDDAYGKTTADIKTPATQYTDLMEAIGEDEEVTAAAIVDMNSKVIDISTRLDNIVISPAIWVGTQSQYNSLESINQSTIYIIRAE